MREKANLGLLFGLLAISVSGCVVGVSPYAAEGSCGACNAGEFDGCIGQAELSGGDYAACVAPQRPLRPLPPPEPGPPGRFFPVPVRPVFSQQPMEADFGTVEGGLP